MAEADYDYERQKRFMAVLAGPIFGVAEDSDIHPFRVLSAMEAQSRSKAKLGLRMAVNDLIEVTSGLTASEVTDFDATLAVCGAITLTEARIRFSKAINAVVRRGKIRTEDEYNVVRNAADFEGADSKKLWRLLSEFELRGDKHG